MPDVVVVGLGAMGAAVLRALARRGVRALGLDRFSPPHTMGSSHGESRITRMAVGEGPAYAGFVRRSHALWRELEAETGCELMRTTGGLIIGPASGADEHHGRRDFVRSSIAVAAANGIAHEALDAAAMAARWPQLGLSGDEIGCFEHTAGVVFPEACIAAQLDSARRHGAETRMGVRVTGVHPDGAGVRVETDQGPVRADRAVLAAGAWLPGLAGGVLARRARVLRQALHWFPVEEPAAYAPDRFPIVIWMHGSGPEDYFYGFPSLDGATVKLATERYDATWDPDDLDRNPPPGAAAELLARHAGGRLRGVRGPALRSLGCLYTTTPDSGFVVDRMEGVPGAIILSACSGHGFKHSAGLGEAVAELACDEDRPELDPFGLSRLTP